MSRREAAGRLPSAPLERGPDPPAADPFLQFCLAAVGPGQVVENGRGRIGTAQYGLRQLEQRGGLIPGPCGLHRAPGREVDHAADGHRDRHEQQQGQQFLGLLDRERVERHREVPVEQQAGCHRGQHGGPETAHYGDRHHDDEVDEQVVGDVQVRPEDREHVGEQREHRGGQQHGGEAPPGVDGPGLVGRNAARLGLRLSRAALGTPGGQAPAAHARIGTHAYQCEPSDVPTEHQARTCAGQRDRADDYRRMRGGRSRRPKLPVGRPGEAHGGEPADASQQDGRHRLGREGHHPGHRRGGDQHPGRVQPSVQRGGHRPDGQERGEADRQRKGRRYSALFVAESHHLLLFQPQDQAISAPLTDP